MLHSLGLRSFTKARAFSFQSSIIKLQQLLNDNYVIYLTVSYVNFTNLCDNYLITEQTVKNHEHKQHGSSAVKVDLK